MKTKIIIGLLAFLMLSCSDDNDLIEQEVDKEEIVETYDDTDFETTDWTTATHSKNADLDFNEVFDNTTVKRLDFVITEDRWQSMLDNMTELYGPFGLHSAGPSGMPGGTPPDDSTADSEENPNYVPAEVFFKDNQWYRVGVRFKGNSSLKSSWQAGILKLSFKLDFDEFEDYYPQIDNQRFYGFKKLSLKNNYDDKSGLREKVASDIFERAGLAVSHTAFYSLYIDHGNGPEYFGLYTLVEEVDDTLIDTQFSSDNGNLYKPENTGASFAEGTFNETDFEKKTNEDELDWSDIQNLFSVLHDETRISAPETWRADLEKIFDTDVFLRYLAVNTVMQNWDTYGIMPHNYYLYNNPYNNKLTWIPWDNNEALQEGKMRGALTLDFANMEKGAWPLIEYIYADNAYRAIYDDYVQETIDGAFESGDIQDVYTRYGALVAPYVESELPGYSFLNNSGEFQQALSQLKVHVKNRDAAVAEYLE